jgi:hypothetical protein
MIGTRIEWTLFLLSCFGVIAMTNCGADPSPKPSPNVVYTQEDRFDVAKHSVPGDNPDIWTITDRDTHCQYMFTKLGYAGGLVVMPNTCKNN